MKQSNCFPSLSHEEKNRKFCKDGKFCEDGCLPVDPAHRVCLLGCKHHYVNEPNANKGLHDKHSKEMREFENKKKAAADEALEEGQCSSKATKSDTQVGEAPSLVSLQATALCECRKQHRQWFMSHQMQEGRRNSTATARLLLEAILVPFASASAV